MPNQRVVLLPWRYKIEWTAVLIIVLAELAFVLFDALRNFSIEPAAVGQLASTPMILGVVTVFGVWRLARWVFWLLLIQLVLAAAVIGLIVGAFSGGPGIWSLFLLIVPGTITLWLYWDVLRYSSKYAPQSTKETQVI